MDRWQRFKGRDLNAHMPTKDMHRRMLAALRPMGTHGQLTATKIVELLNAQVHPDNR
jgi:hypothetical protein